MQEYLAIDDIPQTRQVTIFIGTVLKARRRMASSKMKRVKQSGSKEQEELEEDNEELFNEIGA
jgi:hypothetical protein